MSSLSQPSKEKGSPAAPGQPDAAETAPSTTDPFRKPNEITLLVKLFALIWLIWQLKISWLIPIGLALVGWQFGLGSALIALIFVTLGIIVGCLGILLVLVEMGFTVTKDRDAEGQPQFSVDRQPKRASRSAKVGGPDRDLPPIESALHAGSALYAFASRFPEAAARETLLVKIDDDYPDLPKGMFMFSEYYCIDPDCDCRRVQIVVTDLNRPRKALATFGYGWGSVSYYQKRAQDRAAAELMTGTALESLAKQSKLAPSLMEAFAILQDDKRTQRSIRKHYRMMRESGTNDVVQSRSPGP